MLRIAILFLLFYQNVLHAQYNHVDILTKLEGSALFEPLIKEFKAKDLLSYKECRKVMFTKIDLKNDSIECVYTGYKKYLDPKAKDPISYLYNKGLDNSINTEHSYPQSKGASRSMAKSDLHHLFPTRSNVNSARGSNPFKEVPDKYTSAWYYSDDRLETIPVKYIDGYSEVGPKGFEPRETVKGNIARAIFYFYTFYRKEAIKADKDFFNRQKATLIKWHEADPVDKEEWDRTYEIAKYQQNKPNPFVLDESLILRLYGGQKAKQVVKINKEKTNRSSKSGVHFYNSEKDGSLMMDFSLIANSSIIIGVYNKEGEIINYDKIKLSKGSIKVPFRNKLTEGNYIVKVNIKNNFENSEFKEKIRIVQ